MVIIFKTSNPPRHYMAYFTSLANLFHLICEISKYLFPLLICFAFLQYKSNINVASEFPCFIPLGLSFFSAQDKEGNKILYTDKTHPQGPFSVFYIPTYSNNMIESFTVKIQLGLSNILYFSLALKANISFSQWSNSTFNTIICLNRIFPSYITNYSAYGDLNFEQNEIIQFRGSFSNLQAVASDSLSLTEKQKNMYNSSALFYVNWNYENSMNLSSTSTSEIQFKINVKTAKIYHYQPLVEWFENILFCYLSTHLFLGLILDAIQNFVFSRKLLSTWVIPLYKEPNANKIHDE